MVDALFPRYHNIYLFWKIRWSFNLHCLPLVELEGRKGTVWNLNKGWLRSRDHESPCSFNCDGWKTSWKIYTMILSFQALLRSVTKKENLCPNGLSRVGIYYNGLLFWSLSQHYKVSLLHTYITQFEATHLQQTDHGGNFWGLGTLGKGESRSPGPPDLPLQWTVSASLMLVLHVLHCVTTINTSLV